MGQFAMLTDWSDHYYASNRSDEDMIDIANKTLYKRISEELCTLRTDLPSTIFVGCYYDRVDLLRAAIIGADNNIYFFDLAFRDDFPNKPLQVHYRSNGLLINPNLYNDGQVCLSPLNASEHFQSPEDSLVFLILLQIQELVRPFDKLVLPWREYNKDAFLLAFKTMMFNLNMPPKNFEDFVESFYHERRDSIITACQDYMDPTSRSCYINSKIGKPLAFKEELKEISLKLHESFSNTNKVAKNLSNHGSVRFKYSYLYLTAVAVGVFVIVRGRS